MISKRVIIPGLLVGAALAVGTTAFAFYPEGFNMEAISSFSVDQQNAIEQAEEIRKAADEQAQAVLDAAGVDQEAMHEAMHTYREAQGEKMKAVLDSGDYSTFVTLIADTPMADTMTEDIFNKMVEANKLREAGDDEGARAIMDELRDQGVGFFGPHSGFGPREGHHADEVNSQ